MPNSISSNLKIGDTFIQDLISTTKNKTIIPRLNDLLGGEKVLIIKNAIGIDISKYVNERYKWQEEVITFEKFKVIDANNDTIMVEQTDDNLRLIAHELLNDHKKFNNEIPNTYRDKELFKKFSDLTKRLSKINFCR